MFDYMNTIDDQELYTTKYNYILCNTGDSGNVSKIEMNRFPLYVDERYMHFNYIRLF